MRKRLIETKNWKEYHPFSILSFARTGFSVPQSYDGTISLMDLVVCVNCSEQRGSKWEAVCYAKDVLIDMKDGFSECPVCKDSLYLRSAGDMACCGVGVLPPTGCRQGADSADGVFVERTREEVDVLHSEIWGQSSP